MQTIEERISECDSIPELREVIEFAEMRILHLELYEGHCPACGDPDRNCDCGKPAPCTCRRCGCEDCNRNGL